MKQDVYRRGYITVTYRQKKIRRGTLLIALTHEESKRIAGRLHHVHNYKSMGDMNVSLFCEPHLVYQITREQRNMLHGVTRLEDRLKVLDKLDWVVGLRCGSYLYVTVPSIPDPVRGFVRHIGRLRGHIGTMFGVELMVCACMHIRTYRSW